MKNILMALVPIITGFIVNMISKKGHPWKTYMVIYVVYFFFLMSMDCRAETYFQPIESKLDHGTQMYYFDKMDFHERSGDYHFKKAEDIAWYLPETDDYIKAHYCFNGFLATFGVRTPMSKIVAGCITFLSSYGLSCMMEWQKMQTHLYESRYHYEMSEFYYEVLQKA